MAKAAPKKGKISFEDAVKQQEAAWAKSKGKEFEDRGGNFEDKPIEKGLYDARLVNMTCGVDKNGAGYFSWKIAIHAPGEDYHGNVYGDFKRPDWQTKLPWNDGETEGDQITKTLRALGVDTDKMKGKIGQALPKVAEEFTKEKPWVQVYLGTREATDNKPFKVYPEIKKIIDDPS